MVPDRGAGPLFIVAPRGRGHRRGRRSPIRVLAIPLIAIAFISVGLIAGVESLTDTSWTRGISDGADRGSEMLGSSSAEDHPWSMLHRGRFARRPVLAASDLLETPRVTVSRL